MKGIEILFFIQKTNVLYVKRLKLLMYNINETKVTKEQRKASTKNDTTITNNKKRICNHNKICCLNSLTVIFEDNII